MSDELRRPVRKVRSGWLIDLRGGLISFVIEALIVAVLFGFAVLVGLVVIWVV